MRVSIPYLYQPHLTMQATMALPVGTDIHLKSSFDLVIPEYDAEEAPVVLTWRDGNGNSIDLRRLDGQLYEPVRIERPMGAPRPVSVSTLEALVEAGYTPAKDTLEGCSFLTPTNLVAKAAVGKALESMLPKSSPSQAVNRNIISSGNFRQVEAGEMSKWRRLDLAVIGGTIWQRVLEPVLIVRNQFGKTSLLAAYPDSQVVRSAATDDVFLLDDADLALGRSGLGEPALPFERKAPDNDYAITP